MLPSCEGRFPQTLGSGRRPVITDQWRQVGWVAPSTPGFTSLFFFLFNLFTSSPPYCVLLPSLFSVLDLHHFSPSLFANLSLSLCVCVPPSKHSWSRRSRQLNSHTTTNSPKQISRFFLKPNYGRDWASSWRWQLVVGRSSQSNSRTDRDRLSLRGGARAGSDGILSNCHKWVFYIQDGANLWLW